jgi:hypothetical protein
VLEQVLELGLVLERVLEPEQEPGPGLQQEPRNWRR